MGLLSSVFIVIYVYILFLSLVPPKRNINRPTFSIKDVVRITCLNSRSQFRPVIVLNGDD